jgi:hypothetical protein
MVLRRGTYQSPYPAGSIKQTFVKSYLHSPRWASRYAQFTGAALLTVKNHLHVWSFDVKAACRAHGCAGTTMETFFFIPFYILPDAFYLNPKSLEVTNPALKIFSVPSQLKHHKAFFSRVDCRLEDIKGEVKLPDQVNDYGLVYDLSWKPQSQYFGVHGFLPIEFYVDSEFGGRESKQKTHA